MQTLQPTTPSVDPNKIVGSLAMPIIVIGAKNEIDYVNHAAEQFFDMGADLLTKHRLTELLTFGSPLLQLVEQARERGSSVAERNVDLSTVKGGERIADVTLTPAPEHEGGLVVLLQEKGLSQRIDKQLRYRGAVRSMSGMSAVLAHEIKNPLSGIRGAAQLLEDTLSAEDRTLARLIRDESDRIRELIDRMEAFGDPMAQTRLPVNIHEVIDRVRQVAATSFARDIRIIENFDPSLPPVPGDRDNLIQAFMNILRNAADASPTKSPEITIATAYRPGVSVTTPISGQTNKVSLPLEITIRDNGPGIPKDLLPHIFDPFVTTKTSGAGLGLALVAKIINDHGGVIECDSKPGRTIFRVLLPVTINDDIFVKAD
jgi:two-component system nitrogen regulation sensor histidine kinase GlnL